MEAKVDLSVVTYDEKGLVPAVVQEENGQVLMLAYMNEESLKKTLATGYTWFYSRSRQKLWKKGEESGNVQKVKEISYDCDGDTLLVRVHQTGVACHTGSYTCFSGRKLAGEEESRERKGAEEAFGRKGLCARRNFERSLQSHRRSPSKSNRRFVYELSFRQRAG